MLEKHADLSEPVDGVKQQSANKVPLGFGQTLHFLHDVEVDQDQGAACGRGHKPIQIKIVKKKK